jgi:hypothetical protein
VKLLIPERLKGGNIQKGIIIYLSGILLYLLRLDINVYYTNFTLIINTY